MKALSARHTVSACYVGYITQAIVNNFAPLLFLLPSLRCGADRICRIAFELLVACS